MSSLELRCKTKEEVLEWRHALERAMTPSSTSIQEHLIHTKNTYMRMSEVIQKHIDELSESQTGTALQVLHIAARSNFSLHSLIYFLRHQIYVKSLCDINYLLKKKLPKNEDFFVQVTCGSQSFRTNCFKVIVIAVVVRSSFIRFVVALNYLNSSKVQVHLMVQVKRLKSISETKASYSQPSQSQKPHFFLAKFTFSVVRPTVIITLMSTATGVQCFLNYFLHSVFCCIFHHF
jgi:hypothetical protein